MTHALSTAIPCLDLAHADQFRVDVLRGLAAPAREIPSKYFYDEAGSRLFDRICELEEYYPTRTELAIMRRHREVMAALLGPGCLLIEYGSGSGVKSRLLLDQLDAPAGYVPVDIAREHLAGAATALARKVPHVEILPVCADFTRPLTLPVPSRLPRRRVVYFPGSTVGNLVPDEVIALFHQTARLCGPGGGMLVGADLKKDPAVLHAAYNDREGVTAAFNFNLLARINRELEGNFRLDRYWHHAFYNPHAGRIEMHLVSRADQHVRVGGKPFAIAEGESIRTEYSYKYSRAELRDLAAAGGFVVRRTWTDDREYFGVMYMEVAE
jgi:dimethylhistidine N-methyltransferase